MVTAGMGMDTGDGGEEDGEEVMEAIAGITRAQRPAAITIILLEDGMDMILATAIGTTTQVSPRTLVTEVTLLLTTRINKIS